MGFIAVALNVCVYILGSSFQRGAEKWNINGDSSNPAFPGRDLRIEPLSYNSVQDHLCQERDEEAGVTSLDFLFFLSLRNETRSGQSIMQKRVSQ